MHIINKRKGAQLYYTSSRCSWTLPSASHDFQNTLHSALSKYSTLSTKGASFKRLKLNDYPTAIAYNVTTKSPFYA